MERLDVPFREQNVLLLAAGHAPAFPERSLDDPALAPVRDALHSVLARHEPYPAVAVDRHWNLIAANRALLALTEGADIDPALLGEPVNVLRLDLHPRGLAPLIANYAEWRAHFRERVERQLAATQDEQLGALLREISGYPLKESSSRSEESTSHPREFHREVLGPLDMWGPDGGVLSFVGMFAAFDTPFEVTSSELAVELFFPADRATADTLERMARARRGPAVTSSAPPRAQTAAGRGRA
jgi:hypothetical protein